MSGQEHWERTPEECAPIAVPLTRMINRMPAKQVAKLYELIDPAMLAVGIAQVAGPSAKESLERYKQSRSTPLIQGATGRTPPESVGGDPRTNGRNTSTVQRDGQGIPSANAPFIGGTF